MNNKNLIDDFLEKDKTKNNKSPNVEEVEKIKQLGSSKCLNIAMAGIPNAGKSSIMNALIGEKISIISPKVQTTRNVIKGVLIEGNTQLILIDTPGIFIPKKDRLLERKIVKNAWSGVQDADVVCIIIDSSKGITEKVRTLITDISKKQQDIIFILNKVDLIKKEQLLFLADYITKMQPNYKELFMVSVKTGVNLDKLKKYLFSIAQEGEWLFKDGEITDAPMKLLASEITREKLFLRLSEDLPYSIDVYTENWEKFKNGSIKIQQVIRVLKESQKAIVLGKGGQNLKYINIEARKEMEEFFAKKIHLFLFVKIDNKWIEETTGMEK